NGSHGCINTPYDAMARIYEMVEVGTPVVMYY
ncbi:MAG: L,D-transpeptidase, partial [Acetatifactor sp.]|nr:L,D-transpeptidase [Acetatifactor sp.]